MTTNNRYQSIRGGLPCNVQGAEAACQRRNSMTSYVRLTHGNVSAAANCLIRSYWRTGPAATMSISAEPVPSRQFPIQEKDGFQESRPFLYLYSMYQFPIRNHRRMYGSATRIVRAGAYSAENSSMKVASPTACSSTFVAVIVSSSPVQNWSQISISPLSAYGSGIR